MLLATNQVATESSDKSSADKTIAEQINELKGERRAVFDEQKNCIYLYMSDYPITLIKELKKGKKGKHKATTKFNYKTKLWELKGFTLITVRFLFSNGFDISEDLIDYAVKLKKKNDSNTL